MKKEKLPCRKKSGGRRWTPAARKTGTCSETGGEPPLAGCETPGSREMAGKTPEKAKQTATRGGAWRRVQPPGEVRSVGVCTRKCGEEDGSN